MSLVVNKLGYAGFPLKGIDVQLQQIKSIIYHHQIAKHKEYEVETEKKRMRNIYDQLRNWIAKVAMKKEIDRVEEPGYCSFAVIRFYGTHFPDELAKNTSGYVIRIMQDMDIPKLSDLLRKIFTGKQKFAYGSNTK